MRGQRPDRRVGAAAAIDRDMRKLPAADFRIGPSGPVELALVVERRRLGPGPAQQGNVLRGAAIAGLMVGPVAVLGLIGVATNPGRCAKRKLSRSVTDAACAPTRNPSGASEK